MRPPARGAWGFPNKEVHIMSVSKRSFRMLGLLLVGSAFAIVIGIGAAGAQQGPNCPNPNVIQGTAGPDVILGTPGNDLINGRGGDDVIDGLGGGDCVRGGPGMGTVPGGEGND